MADPYAPRLQQVLGLMQYELWPQALEASGALEPVMPATPALGRLWFLRATLAQKLGAPAAALEAFTQVWRSYPPLADYAAWELAQVYAAQDRLDDLQAIVAGMVTTYPSSRLRPNAQLLLAQTQERLGVVAEARATLERLRLSTPEHAVLPAALALLARLYEASGERVAAAQVWQQLGETYPRRRGAAEALARSRLLWIQTPEAYRPPVDPVQLLASMDQIAAAKLWTEVEARLMILMQVTGPDTLVATILLKRGELAVQRQQWSEAETVLQTFIAREPQSPQRPAAHALLAEVYQHQGDDARRLEQYAHILRYGPKSPQAATALFALGQYYEEQGNNEAARLHYRNVSETFPDYELAQERLWEAGWEHYTQRRYEAAERLWNDFIRYFPNASLMPQVLYWKARVAEHLGHQQDAIALYQRIVFDYPVHYYSVQAQAALPAASVPSPPATVSAVPVVAPATPELVRLSQVSATGQPSPERFHLIRAQEFHQLRMASQATLEIRALDALLPDTPAVHYFLAALFVDNQRYIDAFRLLNGTVSHLSPAEVRGLPREFWRLLYPRPFWNEVVEQARSSGLNPYLILSIIRQESAFNPVAVSRSGARGLMQLMPATAREVAARRDLDTPTRDRLREPQFNITLGADYFATTLRRVEGNLVLALAGYNAGPSRATRWRQQWPDLPMDEFIERIPFQETRLYVKLILRNLMLYERLYSDLS